LGGRFRPLALGSGIDTKPPIIRPKSDLTGAGAIFAGAGAQKPERNRRRATRKQKNQTQGHQKSDPRPPESRPNGCWGIKIRPRAPHERPHGTKNQTQGHQRADLTGARRRQDT